MKLFTNSLTGTFVRRPNRFVVEAETRKGLISAHCPNPGRMLELLLPDTRLILESSSNLNRKYPYTLVAAYYKNKVIPLHSSRVNQAAEQLFLPHFFPEATCVSREYTAGTSRFDFYIEEKGKRHLIEVKGCTLVHNGVAMFPDAPTLRGSRHIHELLQLNREGFQSHLLIVIMHGDANLFIPDIHTDPRFALAFAEAEKEVSMKAVSLEAGSDGTALPVSFEIPVDTRPVELVRKNTGIYLIIITFLKRKSVSVGSLGTIDFAPGFYVYTGSAKSILAGRVGRHVRKRKTKRWHIDYLVAEADGVQALPVYTGHDLECPAALGVAELAEKPIPGFGCSDCRCESHLHYFKNRPFHSPDFNDFILTLRHSTAFSASSIQR